MRHCRRLLWRINHGWRKSVEQTGFAIDTGSGRWRSNDDVEDEPEAYERRGPLISGLKPYVTDIRNLLLLRPSAAASLDEVFLE